MTYIVMYKNKKDKTYKVIEVEKSRISKVVKTFDIVFVQPNIFEEYVVPEELSK